MNGIDRCMFLAIAQTGSWPTALHCAFGPGLCAFVAYSQRLWVPSVPGLISGTKILHHAFEIIRVSKPASRKIAMHSLSRSSE